MTRRKHVSVSIDELPDGTYAARIGTGRTPSQGTGTTPGEAAAKAVDAAWALLRFERQNPPVRRITVP